MSFSLSMDNEWTFDAESMRDLITGKISWRRCYACDNGVIWWDEEGNIISAQQAADTEDQLSIDSGPCDDCHGVGFILMEYY